MAQGSVPSGKICLYRCVGQREISEFELTLLLDFLEIIMKILKRNKISLIRFVILLFAFGLWIFILHKNSGQTEDEIFFHRSLQFFKKLPKTNKIYVKKKVQHYDSDAVNFALAQVNKQFSSSNFRNA